MDTQKRLGKFFKKTRLLSGLFSWLSSKLSANTILIIFLIVSAYLIGSLRTEVAYLKKSPQITPASTQAPTQPSQLAPQPPTGAVPEITEKDHIKGNRNAQVFLVEYADFECPFCKRFHPTMQQILVDYGGKVAWVYRHYPLDFHANAQKEAEAAECAGELGGNAKFWEYTDKIYERTQSNGTGFALETLVPLATEVGLDGAKFKQCLDSQKFAKHVKDEFAAGQAAGIRGTPGTFVLAKGRAVDTIHGALPLDQIKQRVDAALGGSGSQ